MKTFDVKEMLMKGTSKEELMKKLENEIESAQKEIEEAKAAEIAKKKHNEDIDKSCRELVAATVNYFDQVGLIDKKYFNEEDYKDIEKLVKETFNLEFLPYISMKKKLNKSDKKNKSFESATDEIIKEFLKSI